MKNVRIILLAVALATVAATAVLGITLGATWAVIVAAAGIVVVVLLVGYVQTKTTQLATQRLAGLQKQNERILTNMQIIQASVQAARIASKTAETRVAELGNDQSAPLPREVQRAFEDLSLASRSLTVPQVHFDQLLRTISANTVRTESALNDAVEEIRLLGRDGSAPTPQESNGLNNS
ncbi:hypothetical protein [Naumannella halotolerans]|uniref:Uncharacterized protein n=1 Tax=Naumannella halotolerans TaxID=993414 RepID=A0A4V3EMF8_9ACTN|nr:hypothetical protein [Naumannella halotolerans]TDT29958.1 hypothetical protein CLV29_2981 [Naumannella halotolerans]